MPKKKRRRIDGEVEVEDRKKLEIHFKFNRVKCRRKSKAIKKR